MGREERRIPLVHLGATKKGIFLCLLRCYSQMEKIPLRQTQLLHTGGSPLLERVSPFPITFRQRDGRTLQAGRNRKKRSPYAKGLPGTTLPSFPHCQIGIPPSPLAPLQRARTPMFVCPSLFLLPLPEEGTRTQGHRSRRRMSRRPEKEGGDETGEETNTTDTNTEVEERSVAHLHTLCDALHWQC